MSGNVNKLFNVVIKETKVLVRDPQALLILFIMPVVFVVIMTLAMQDTFQSSGDKGFRMVVFDLDRSEVSEKIVNNLGSSKSIQLAVNNQSEFPDQSLLRKYMRENGFKFAFIIPAGTGKSVNEIVRRKFNYKDRVGKNEKTTPATLVVLADPAVKIEYIRLVESRLNEGLLKTEQKFFTSRVEKLSERKNVGTTDDSGENSWRLFRELKINGAGDQMTAVSLPTSVQQNVPAYTLFAMFFLVIPLSTVLLGERQEGTLQRLKTMPVPGWVYLSGKLLPYFVINQLQVLLLFLTGVYLIPLLGGERLEFGDSILFLGLLTVVSSFAAIGFGLLIAVFARSNEQATNFGGTSIIIMAALGGILVPRMVMPDFMQQVSSVSPLAWGLDGFHNILLYNAGLFEMGPIYMKLLIFSVACFLIAVWRYRKLVS